MAVIPTAPASEVPAGELVTSAGSTVGVRGRVFEVAALLGIVLSLFLVMSFDYGRDQSIYAVVAREMLRGAMPYRDVFDFKPPGIFLIYALARAAVGQAHWGVRLIECGSMAACVAGLVFTSRKALHSQGIGLLAGAVYCLAHAGSDFWHTAQPESFGAAFIIWGLALAVLADGEAAGRRRVLFWSASGALFGFCLWLKPPLGAGGPLLAVGAGLFPRARPERLSERAIPLVAFSAGALVSIGAVCGWFLAKGALHDLYEVLFVFAPRYTQLGWGYGWKLKVLYFLNKWLSLHSNAVWFGVFLLIVMRPRFGQARLVAGLLLLIVVQGAGILVQSKFFTYHWGATYPLTALLAALGWAGAWQAARRRSIAAEVAVVAVAVLLAATPRWHKELSDIPDVSESLGELWTLVTRTPSEAHARDGLPSLASGDAPRNRAISDYLAAGLPAGSPIFVWGFEPAIYDQSGLPIASRYIYTVPQMSKWSAESSRAILMQDLAEHAPAAILVQHHDALPWVTGTTEDSSAGLRHFPALSNLLAGSYHLDLTGGDLDIYLRNDVKMTQQAP
jgi:hypothetical protein